MAALVAAFLFAPSPAQAGCQTSTCHERVARKNCTQRNVQPCITRAILTYKLQPWQAAWMRRVAFCESRHNPYARNSSGATGLFQFMPGTWWTTPYARRSIYSAKWQALAAAWMISRAGRSREWVCR